VPPLITVEHRRGIYLPEADLWLDPPCKVARAFISHAHSDHVGRHALSFCTERTQEIIGVRYRLRRGLHPLPLREPVEWEGWTLQLLPAGHIPGSAMLHLTRQSDGATLLYTGDYKLRPGLCCEPCELMPADTLIMECTFGQPRYEFPPLTHIVEEIRAFCRDTLADSHVPVLLGYSLGKAQEILCALSGTGLRVMAHRTVLEMTAACGPLPVEPVACAPFDPAHAAGSVVVFPPSAARMPELLAVPQRRTAMCTGWALTPGARYRCRTDAMFPLSDHASWSELLETVAAVQPRRVYAVHGFTQEFTAALRARGHDAWSLGCDDQLELLLQ
jgi:DNA ligase 1